LTVLAVAFATTVAAQPAAGVQKPPLPVLGSTTVVNWGSNFHGQLGIGSTTPLSSPSALRPVGLYQGVAQVSAGSFHTLALLDDGTVVAWGGNLKGELGNGSTTDSSVPVPVAGLGNVVAVSAGNHHSLALLADGTVRAWGGNLTGELGDGTSTDRLTPVPVPGLTGVVQVSAGTSFSLALKADGTVWAWGHNWAGQLGDGTTTNRHTPVPVSRLGNVVQISAGQSHSLALRSNGRASAWGSNANGQLGTGNHVDQPTPAQVVLLAGISQVAAGGWFSLFLINTEVYQWGASPVGGSPNQVATLLAVGLRDVQQISAAYPDGLALRSDATVWQWNADPDVLAPSDPTPVAVDPVQVKGVADARQVDGGGYHSAAVVKVPFVIGPPNAGG
jgi:alpha-tubulin suppressor-like RCC1 family protein